MKRMIASATLGIGLLASASASAYDGYITRTVSLRAGPDASYPAVSRIRRGTSVVIEGCVEDWSWCDVSSRNDRGWVDGNYLQHEYHGRRVLIPRYGVQIGIPVISFVFGSYWDDHYRSRSWYRERDRWSRVTPRYERRHSRTGTAPSPAPRESRPSGANAPQPSYQTSPQAPAVAPPAQAAPVRTPERTASPSRPPVERSAVEQRAPAQQVPTAPRAGAAAGDMPAQHREAAPVPQAPARTVPEQAKSPPAQPAAHDKGKDQGTKGQSKDKKRDGDKGKDKEQDGGG